MVALLYAKTNRKRRSWCAELAFTFLLIIGEVSGQNDVDQQDVYLAIALVFVIVFLLFWAWKRMQCNQGKKNNARPVNNSYIELAPSSVDETSSICQDIEIAENTTGKKLKSFHQEVRINWIDPSDITSWKKIREGGFAEIWRCQWSNNYVAVKCKLPFKHCKSGTEDSVDMIEHEIKILSKLNHPSIIKCYGACRDPPKKYIVLEYYRRGSLDDILHRQPDLPINTQKRLQYMLETAWGMAYLHGLDPCIIHRDLKPANLLVTNDNKIKVCDFGISYPAYHGEVNKSDGLKGTAAYLSPEYLRHAEFTEKTDVWSFGVTIFEIYRRERAYANMDEHQIASAILIGNYCKLDPPKSETDSFVGDIIKRCFSHNPKDRPSFDDLAAKLDNFSEKRR